jgi:hypothetical protein
MRKLLILFVDAHMGELAQVAVGVETVNLT